jgi:glutathione S-transferase
MKNCGSDQCVCVPIPRTRSAPKNRDIKQRNLEPGSTRQEVESVRDAKALIALYENATPFELKMLGSESPQNFDALKKLWPLGKFPVLDDNDVVVFEATSIIEHLALHHPGLVPLIPVDPRNALDVRTMDRVFDNYVMTPMNWIVQDARRPTGRETRTPLRKVARCLMRPTVGSTNA